MKTKWLERTVLFGGYLCLCLSDKEAKAALKHCGVKHEFIPTSNGRIFSFEKDGKYINIVVLNNISGHDLNTVHGLIVHEATHARQLLMKYLNESNPGNEIEAYVTQCISQTLMDELQERVVVKNNVVTKIKARHEKRHLKTK